MKHWLAGWLAVWLMSAEHAAAQDWHVVLLADKGDTTLAERHPAAHHSVRAIARRERQGIGWTDRDYAVDSAYLDSLAQLGATVRYASRWLNAALIRANDQQLEVVLAQGFVAGLHPRMGNLQVEASAEAAKPLPIWRSKDTYGEAANQIRLLGLEHAHQRGYEGQGIQIAVTDAGFIGVDQQPAFADLRERGGLLGAWDLVDNDRDPYHAHDHGTKVLSIMAAQWPGQLVGGAPQADYWLIRTEDTRQESPLEEFLWLIAAEKADSLGADLINVSLGYTTYDDPSRSYTPDDLDGQTSLISRAADWASATGMLVVTSAGNQGRLAWRNVSMPGDAESILTVGAVNAQGVYNPASSYGPTADGRIKPEVMAMGTLTAMLDGAGRVVKTGGTSYAAPMVTSLAAALWQAYPALSQQELKAAIMQSGTLATNPEAQQGYGIPHFLRAYFGLAATALPDAAVAEWQLLRQGNTWQLAAPANLQGQPLQITIFDLQGRQHWANRVESTPDLLPLPMLSHPLLLVKIQHQQGTTLLKWLR